MLSATQEEAMFCRAVSQCAQSLKNLETCLDKAEQHAAARNFDVNVLMTSRLAPDQLPFIYQTGATIVTK
jgi:uncharacterized protein